MRALHPQAATLLAQIESLGDPPLEESTPAAVRALRPVTDTRGGTDSYEAQKDGPWLTKAEMDWFLGHYLRGGRGSPDDPPRLPPPGARRGARELARDTRPHSRARSAP